MRLGALPSQACWRLEGSRDGFEVCWPVSIGAIHRLRGASTGVQDGDGWTISYDVEVGPDWRTRVAQVQVAGRDGSGELLLERDTDHRWSLDGVHRGDLDGVLDVHLDASAVSHTLPVRRLDLAPGARMQVDVAHVRRDLRVQRVTWTYELVTQTDDVVVVSCAAPDLGVDGTLTLDAAGLVTDHPDRATRVG
ncbi:putative glycolipid-binding domain-containing protein [Nocardioides rubriscoriae]|uniref:putative glycolipid-binding domain-containing protein n=1 Tax=Nocardioides rubriscoriae TaxID=642762 RepID=UPI001479644D|nr:putative glycolipid-binding domain-containing protein [Nocardioides rubriscoriae]